MASRSVLDGGEPVLRVLLDRDGVLQCTAGEGDEDADRPVPFGDLLARDDCLGHLPRLYAGFYAERDAAGAPWRREHDHDHVHPEETEAEERARIEERIAATGWYCLQVAGTDEDSGGLSDFAYTAGLRETFAGHPDLIVFDRDLEAAYAILASVVDELRTGRRLRRGDRSTAVLEGSEVLFCGVPATARTSLMTYTDWLYDREPFEALQVIWPDTEDLWPWEEGSRGSYQPFLALDAPWRDEDATEVARDVEAVGGTWVSWEADGFDAAMTLGLTGTFDHPELLIVLEDDVDGTGLLDAIIDEVRAGGRLAPGDRRTTTDGTEFEVAVSDAAARDDLAESILEHYGVPFDALLELRSR